MNNLLQKASEEYPLREPDDKWHVIEQAIVAQTESGYLLPYQKYQRWYAFGLLLLLLFVGLIIGNQDKHISGLPAQAEAAIKNESTDETPPKTVEPLEKIVNPTDIQKKKEPISRLADDDKGIKAGPETLIETNGVPEKPKHEIPPLSSLYDNRSDISSITVNPQLVAGDEAYSNLPAAPEKEKKRKWYYGLIAGIEVNAVEDQKFSNSNFEMGINGGFRISDRISVESGLSVVKKYYTTNGKYFDMSGMSDMPGNMEMKEVNGNIKVVRIPVSVQIGWVQKKNHRFFSSHGLSSYILAEENNQYRIMLNGTENMMYKSYSSDKKYFAASIDIGIGYERKIGENNSIRVEPYLQLPLKGIGVGLLAFRNAGIHVGLIHNR